MEIWNFDRVTGELVGASFADPNPLEEGEWLLPAFSLAAAPPEPQDGFAIVCTGSTWELRPDHRGETWWTADAVDNTAPVTIDFIGDPAEREPALTSTEPPAPPVVPLPTPPVSARQIRLALNQMGLRAAIEAYVAAADQDTKDTWQFATEFYADFGMVTTGAAALGMPQSDVDALFALAKTL